MESEHGKDNELFGFMGWLAEKYKSSPFGMCNLVLITLLGWWVFCINAEQERRGVAVKAVESVLIKSLARDRGD